MKRLNHLWMHGFSRLLTVLLLSTAAFVPAILAQNAPSVVTYSQPELDQLLAPIALYPDPLLSQVLVAATYPLETIQAARFVQQNPALKGEDLTRAAATQTWDPSVKALLQFPTVLAMMDAQLAWTQKLGDAFLAQQVDVMNTVQALRAKAQQTGTLTSNQQQQVTAQDGAIAIQNTVADTVYVPYYNPTVVYGPWWAPDYLPFVYVPPYAWQTGYFDDAFSVGIAFGLGVGLVDGLFFPVYPDWHGRRFINGRRPGHPGQPAGTPWTHNPVHRLGVAYRDATTGNRFLNAPAGAVNRDAYRGHVENNAPVGQPHAGNSFGAEQTHPFMPAGPAWQTESHSARGQSSRSGSSFGGGYNRRK